MLSDVTIVQILPFAQGTTTRALNGSASKALRTVVEAVLWSTCQLFNHDVIRVREEEGHLIAKFFRPDNLN